jgi:hypothetical protein
MKFDSYFVKNVKILLFLGEAPELESADLE